MHDECAFTSITLYLHLHYTAFDLLVSISCDKKKKKKYSFALRQWLEGFAREVWRKTENSNLSNMALAGAQIGRQ